MKHRAILGSLLVAGLLALALPVQAAPSYKVMASFSVIGDLVQRIAGDDISVETIVPRGQDVHRWELTPPNVLAIEEADIVFYNGYGLEPWLRHVEAMADQRLRLKPVAERAQFETLPVTVGRLHGSVDPHLWMDPAGASAYVDVIARTLGEQYPEKRDAFEERAARTRESLALLSARLTERLEGIPQTNRVLYTSEAGMAYFARAFDFDYAAIWGSSSERLGSAFDMAVMSERLTHTRPPALFYESTTPWIHMDALSRESNIALAGPLFVDSLGDTDSPAYNYPGMLNYNAELLHRALGGARP
ncbi:zinc ABC transporter substrate-binding protein [Halomonas sp. PAMB 3264]|uniref:metal ABC transporter substrate-binding protein n=1 Tax=unclassified Halomonas TaxID=2609666 RepID=UPI00289D3300|nr:MULTISPECIES: zinc ABC transporter substrate-binding protein [unclassified Halomonas]WNL37868.1 zinc ABC transporter substrate-binding protein [Halomonas sp. PAMB 3232]WNL41184.1 zinc ABC transporter substrate-binding protein [Halomonas sp. PAMB 3264]